MRTPTELVDELVRELLPSSHGAVLIDHVERRAEEFRAIALQADPASPRRAVAAACGNHLSKLHRSLAATAWRL